jgi:hypothetical protein
MVTTETRGWESPWPSRVCRRRCWLSRVSGLLVLATAGGLGGCAENPEGTATMLETFGLLLVGVVFFSALSVTLAGLFRMARRRRFRRLRRDRQREDTR